MQYILDRKRRFFLLGLFGLALWVGCGRRDAIFRAYSDSFAGWWSLDLYADHSFEMHLGGGDFAGQYRLRGDTIFLKYPEASTLGSDLPTAFCIDSTRIAIADLGQDDAGCYQLLGGNWMQIQEDHLPR